LARGALLTRTVGSIIGALCGFIGIVWSITDIHYISEIWSALSGNSSLFFTILYFNLPFSQYLIFATIFGQLLTPSAGLFSGLSMILALLLLVGCILTGIGFYGMYQAGGGAMGVVGLAFGIIGGVAGSVLLILGNVMAIRTMIDIFVWVTVPQYLFIFIGFVILGVSFILMGSASIVVREATAHSGAAAAAGILSIIGGSLLFIYVLALFSIIIGDIFTMIGFILILTAFILWTAVFYGSRNV
jgi:hypothetical protein